MDLTCPMGTIPKKINKNILGLYRMNNKPGLIIE